MTNITMPAMMVRDKTREKPLRGRRIEMGYILNVASGFLLSKDWVLTLRSFGSVLPNYMSDLGHYMKDIIHIMGVRRVGLPIGGRPSAFLL
jgi:hypothetical protein